MKHSTTRCVTLRKVVVRLIEQHEDLKDYLNFLPKTTGFGDVKKLKDMDELKKFERRRYRSVPVICSILCGRL